MAGLQIALDKGEENDWFASNFICAFAAMFVIGMIGLIIWELRGTNNPIMQLRLFRFKNFAICCFLMLLVGGILNAGTVLQPQFLQQLRGVYRDQCRQGADRWRPGAAGGRAGRGHPVGQVSRAQHCGDCAFVFFAYAYWYVSRHLTLDLSFGYNAFLRVIQVLPIPFCFIAITNAAYVGLPKEASNQVAGLINFARNIGGSILISLTGAEVTNRSLFHQARLGNAMNYGNNAYTQQVQQTGNFLGQTAGSGAGALRGAVVHLPAVDPAGDRAGICRRLSAAGVAHRGHVLPGVPAQQAQGRGKGPGGRGTLRRSTMCPLPAGDKPVFWLDVQSCSRSSKRTGDTSSSNEG